MKKFPLVATLLFLFSIPFTIRAQNSGEEIFKKVCSACHTIGKGRLVGPDLGGTPQRLKQEWMIRFIRSSQEMVKSGDTAAVAIFNEYNKIPMPDNQYSDEQIISIIKYIDVTGGAMPVAAGTAAVPAESVDIQYSAETVQTGQALFYGYARFSNGAPPCVACHNINSQSFLGGGRLALDLTGVYVKLGPAGINAIVTNPPFPAMKTALLNHDLKEDEKDALISLFKSVAESKNNNQNTSTAGLIFFVLGLISAIFILFHIYLFYDDRKIT